MVDQIRLILFSMAAFQKKLNDIDLISVTIIALWVSKFPSETSDATYMSALDLCAPKSLKKVLAWH